MLAVNPERGGCGSGDLKTILHKRDSCRALLAKLEGGRVTPPADENEQEDERLCILGNKEGEAQGSEGANSTPVSAISLQPVEEVQASCANWTNDEVIAWLRAFEFGASTEGYVANFEEMGVEGSDLLGFLRDGEAMLEALGVHTRIHRTKILAALTQLVSNGNTR